MAEIDEREEGLEEVAEAVLEEKASAMPRGATPLKRSNDYAHLAPTFTASCLGTIDSFHEPAPRKFEDISGRLSFRYGVICETDDTGAQNIKALDKDRDMKGGSIRQSFFIGIRGEEDTKAREIASANLRLRRMPKKMQVTSQFDQLLIKMVPAAQQKGTDIQQKINDTQFKWWPLTYEPGVHDSVDFDPEPDPNLVTIKELTALAYGTVAERLGSRINTLKVLTAKYTDCDVIADSHGTEIDTSITRARLIIVVKTTKGSEAFGAIGGSSGTLEQMLTRQVPAPEDVDPERLAKDPDIISKDLSVVVKRLAERVVHDAEQLDIAQDTKVLGTEFYVLLPSQTTAVYGHEMVGHPHESDIVVENDRDKTAKINLMSLMGGRASDHKYFSVFDTPETNYQVGKRTITHSWGGMPKYDEYGTLCKKAWLVKGGINVGVMSDHISFEEIVSRADPKLAAEMRKVGLTGNSRSEKFDVTPQVRMRTTVVESDDVGDTNPGKKPLDSVQEMAALVPSNAKGIYAKVPNGGWVRTSDGTFSLEINLGYLIESGKINYDKPVKGIKIADNFTTAQSKIVAIGSSKTVKNVFTGHCGKGISGGTQWVPVEGAGPAILMKGMKLGGGTGFGSSWGELRDEYDRQHQAFAAGKLDEIHIAEIAKDLPPDASQEDICLVTACLSIEDEYRLITGERHDLTTHWVDKDGQIRAKGEVYDL